MKQDDVVEVCPPIEESESSRKERDGIAKLMEMAGRKKMDYVYVYVLDRLGRNVAETPFLMYTLKQMGVITRTKDREYNFDNPIDFVFAVFETFASDIETRKLGERTQRGKKTKFMEGKWVGGKPSFGYKKIEDDKLEIDPELMTIVIDLFTTFKKLREIKSLTAIINEKYCNKIGKLSVGQIRTILSNSIYKGYPRYADLEKNIPSLAMIPRELYDEVQLLIKSKAEKNKQGKTRKPSSFLDDLAKKYSIIRVIKVLDILRPICPKCSHIMIGNGSEPYKDLRLPKFKCKCGYERTIPSKSELGAFENGSLCCPKCGSLDLLKQKSAMGWIKNICQRCSFIFQMEVEKDKDRQVDTIGNREKLELTSNEGNRTLDDFEVRVRKDETI